MDDYWTYFQTADVLQAHLAAVREVKRLAEDAEASKQVIREVLERAGAYAEYVYNWELPRDPAHRLSRLGRIIAVVPRYAPGNEPGLTVDDRNELWLACEMYLACMVALLREHPYDNPGARSLIGCALARYAAYLRG